MNPVPLTWRLLTTEELTKVYLDEMRRDFPQSELKPLSMILNSEAAGTAHTWGIYDGDALTAYLLMVRPVGCAMSQLDYFAVLPRYRASGLGAALLAELPGHETGCQAILIEAECPEKAEDEAMAVRRLGFYARCGLRTAGYDTEMFGVHYKTLYLAGGPVDDAALMEEHRFVYENTFSADKYCKYVRIPFDPKAAPGPKVAWQQ